MNAAPWIIALACTLGCIAYVFWLKRSEAQDRRIREAQAEETQARLFEIAKSDHDAAVKRATEIAGVQGELPLDEWIAQQDAKRGRP